MPSPAPFFEATVRIVAVPKGRPRLGRNGVYTPKKTASFEKEFGWLVKVEMQQQALRMVQPPRRLAIVFTFFLKNKRRRPDVDNLIKAASDALNGILFKDDSQIFKITGTKAYAPIDAITIQVAEVQA